ncbi:MAG: phenylacetate--CoA ligase family protein [Solirubrobacteraceae bacterium]
MFATGLYGLGIRPGDQVAVAFGYGMFIGFWAGHYGLQRLGATPIATGSFDSQKRIELLVSEPIRAILCTPTYALRLAQVAREMGVNLREDSSIEIVVTSGEPRPRRTREVIQREWGAAAMEVAGMTEAGTLLMFECGPEAGGMHVIESDVIDEVLDPDTHKPVAYGDPGIRVMTSLGREGIGVLRYWTNDIVVKRPGSSCGCGRTWDYYEGGITGRADDMRKVRGVLFTPAMVEDVARVFHEVVEFQTVLETIDMLETLVISIEPHPDLDADRREELRRHFGARVKRDIGITPKVSIAEPGSLPRFEMKAKRFTDVSTNLENR